MRIALITDVHANLVALEAVMKDIKAHSCDTILFLGDAVGYGPWPRETVALLRDKKVLGVMGNHDAAIVQDLSFYGLSQDMMDVFEWSVDALSGEEYDWLESLPYTRTYQNLFLSHGAPDCPDRFEYVESVDDIRDLNMDQMPTKHLSCMGHLHEQLLFAKKEYGVIENLIACSDEEFQLYPDPLYYCVVGSVGQPRDKDPMAAWALYDTEEDTLFFKRVDYNIEQVVQEIKKKGLPDSIGERLWYGR